MITEKRNKMTRKQYIQLSAAITLIVLIIIVWSFVAKALSDYPEDCNLLMKTWCSYCNNTNWVGENKVGKGLAWCSNSHFYTGWTPKDDCTVNNAREFCSDFLNQ